MNYEPTIRSLEQINAWFRKGLYPKAIHFWDTFFSFWHKNDKIPMSSIGNLNESLNSKYDKSDGAALESRIEEDEVTLADHATRFVGIYDRLTEAEDRLDGHDTDIQTLRQDMAAGDAQTLAEAKLYTDEREAVILEAAESKDRAVLQEAKGYTDTRETAIMRSVDLKDDQTLQSAKEYTAAREVAILSAVDSKDTSVLRSAKTYTDGRESAIMTAVGTKDAQTLESAKEYTDTRETAILAAADSKDATTLQGAKAYTDTRETVILATADTKDATTLRSAKEYADSVVAALVDNSPEALDTLQELATALGNDPNFATTVMTAIGGKVDKIAGKGLSTNDYTEADRTKLAGITAGANNYVHPNDANTRHVTDSEKATWNAKETTTGAQAKANTALASAKTYADNLVSALIDGSPASLDTLVKLAAAIGNDPNFATTVTTAIGGKVDKIAGKGLSTNDYTEADRTKLAGITAGANNYVHPNDANTRHVTDSEKATWNAKETTTGAQAKADAALASAKTYVDAQVGGSAATVDSALSTTSTNAVQNKVITAALNATQKQLVPATLTHNNGSLVPSGNSYLGLWSEYTAGLTILLMSDNFNPGDQLILEIAGNTPVSFLSPEGGNMLQPLSFADLTPESGFTVIYTIVKSIGLQWVVTKDKYSTINFDPTGGGGN